MSNEKAMWIKDPSKGTEEAITGMVRCIITGRPMPKEKARRGFTVRPSIRTLIKTKCPGFNEDSWINVDELKKFKLEYVHELAKNTGIKPELAEFMAKTVAEHAFLSNTYVDSLKEDIHKSTILELLADNVARFLGSWRFLSVFILSIIGWTIAMRFIPIDAYPYQFLNLLLGIFAACSAPLILISQNRELDRDRKRLLNDFKVNLKNEFELMIIREKVDHIINAQNPSILESLEMLSEDIDSLKNKDS